MAQRLQLLPPLETPEQPERVTAPYLTKFEKARIIGQRAMQLSNGAPPMVDAQPGSTRTAIDLATAEYNQGKIPFIIRRHLPDGSYEDWKFSELKQDSLTSAPSMEAV